MKRSNTCPKCGSTDIGTSTEGKEAYVLVKAIEKGTTVDVDLRKVFPVRPMFCRDCGFVEFYSAGHQFG